MSMKVKMVPHPSKFDRHESGIKQVVLNYAKYLPEFGIEIADDTDDDFDILIDHAGMTAGRADVAHLHGLYWTADYPCSRWEYAANRGIVNAVRNAKEITVPSEWVAETLRRDLHMNPHVLPHGIDIEDWTPKPHQKYVLWNKNRNADVCDPTPVLDLARLNDNINFITTQLPRGTKYSPLQNVRITSKPKSDGTFPPIAHDKMKTMIESAMVYLSTTKETFGIGILEAMVSGVPVLGFAHGGNNELVHNGVNGYLAQPGDIEELNEGLQYCIKYREQLGANGREIAKKYPWRKAVEQAAMIYQLAYEHEDNYDVSVIIPAHNAEETLERAVKSVQEQTYPVREIIIVDDKSSDNTPEIARRMSESDGKIQYIRVENGNVADTRNAGIEQSKSEYICCLDKDDEIAPQFIEACMEEGHKKDRSLGIAYTGLYYKKSKDNEGLSPWPDECNYDKHMSYRNPDNPRGLNQVPTCNVFKKEAWRRAGGYRSKYCPLGAGAEDAELWARMMSLGWSARKITNAGLFIYYAGGQTMTDGANGKDINLIEPFWLSMHPWAKDHLHPFASYATPINKMQSHPVRQYDEPIVSFVVPVGEGHEKFVWEALESIEGQSYRKWEAIVVWDSSKQPSKRFLDAHPYVRMVYNQKPSSGAGFSRNRGAEIARGGFLVFLDADDKIAPEYLRMSLALWEETHSIVFTDYINSFYTSEEDLPNYEGQIVKYFKETGQVLLRGKSADFDCERAQRQPDKDLFHWCLITALVPKAWHDEIGGFDETMETFEDVLYHWVMAYKGYCYVRLPEAMVYYRMYSGKRREKASLYTEQGRAVAKEMLQYCKKVLEGVEKMGCKSCPGSRKPINVMNEINKVLNSEVESARAADENFVKAEYTHPNRGNHIVTGAVTGIKYGYFGGGKKILVHKADIQAQPQFWRPLSIQSSVQQNIPQAHRPELGAPPSLDQSPKIIQSNKKDDGSDDGVPDFIAPSVDEQPDYTIEVDEQKEFDVKEPDFKADLGLIPGLTPNMIAQLKERGIDTPEKILEAGIDGLQEIRGIAEVRAAGIIEYLNNFA
ncbi:glycosyltransferase [Candidatus Bathyarchaeota archaeon]|nr:glycosyltransferase [Candidatus Bathyarchaeota archaeon]